MPRKKSPPKKKYSKRSSGAPNGRQSKRHGLPNVCVLRVSGVNEDGELLATPVAWDERTEPPHIRIPYTLRGKSPAEGSRVLARVKRLRPHLYEAQIMRVLPDERPQAVLGMFVASHHGGTIEPLSRRHKQSYMVHKHDANGAEHGELVRAISKPSGSSLRMPGAEIQERLGDLHAPGAISLVAIHMNDLPTEFSEAALAEAEASEPPKPESYREDLRDIPLVTIDGVDARDFDDAVFAEPTDDGFHIIVAIADVAHYVAEGSALDSDAHERGNSAYFPDRVIPMLPEALSNGLCSLVPNEDRYCLAVHLWIDKEGNHQRYKFVRGIMRSHRRFTYEEVEALCSSPSQGKKDDEANIVANLSRAYDALKTERKARSPLGLNLPEYRVVFDEAGNVQDIAEREQLESHRLIESFMVAANVAAADFLLRHKQPAIYRVHEHPDEAKLDELRTLMKHSGYSIPKGVIQTRHLNRVLQKSEASEERYLIHTAILRAQMQAYYSTDCTGHFGLALKKYCHFTSPIRRYADLVVHRAIISLLEKTAYKPDALVQTAEHISTTERTAMQAERDAADRYKIAFMQQHLGDSFPGTIAGLNEHGLFVALNKNGVNGFVPARTLPNDFYAYDKKRAQFKGRRTGSTYTLGQPLVVKVEEANATTGSLVFALQGGKPPAKPSSDNKKVWKGRSKHEKKRPRRTRKR